MKPKKNIFAVLFSILFFFQCQQLFALDVQIFRPNQNRGEGLTTYSSSALKLGEWQTSLFLNYVKNPLEYGFLDTNAKTKGIVNGTSTANLLFSYGLSDYLTLGLDFPVHIISDIQGIGTTIKGEDNYTVGDPRLFAIIPLLRAKNKDRFGVGLALVPFGTFDFGSTGDFLGNKNFTAGGKLVTDAWMGDRNYLSLNVGYSYRREREVIQNLSVGNEYHYALSYAHVLIPSYGIDLIGEMYGMTDKDRPFKDKITTPIEGLVAARKRWKSFSTTLGGGRGLTRGYGSPDYRFFAGLTYSHLHDDKPAPVPTPSPTPTPTPIPEKKDGMLELSIRDENGTPIVAEVAVLSENGKFKDRIKTSSWKRNLPEGNYQVSIDVPNFQWVYREFSIVSGEKMTESITLIAIKKKGEKIDVLGKILFDLNQASLKPESFPVLDHVVEVLNLHSEITKIRIEAHTDNLASAKYNLNLSNRRALTVHNYLIKSGIDPKRLEYRGYGKNFPIESNDTEEGRAKNRRVEFLVLDSTTGSVKTQPQPEPEPANPQNPGE